MEHCRIEVEEGVALLEICRPSVLNALNSKALEEIIEAIEKIATAGNVRAMVITGAGEKAFIAGADISEMVKKEQMEMLAFCKLGQKATLAIEEAPFPVIAAVNGYALGGGLEIALACDFIYCTESAKFGLPEVSLGIIPGFGGTVRLQQAIGTRGAKEMTCTGRIITAEKALELHLVNAIFSDKEALIHASFKTAKQIASLSPHATAHAKASINSSCRYGIHERLETEAEMCALTFSTEEARVAMDAFLKKRASR